MCFYIFWEEITLIMLRLLEIQKWLVRTRQKLNKLVLHSLQFILRSVSFLEKHPAAVVVFFRACSNSPRTFFGSLATKITFSLEFRHHTSKHWSFCKFSFNRGNISPTDYKQSQKSSKQLPNSLLLVSFIKEYDYPVPFL